MADNTQIYSATYSNVPVFEFVTSEGPIMRRKSDSWINATHILKIAKFPKAKRTRILEKDVQTGVHEKVQGGYGKYQGTYVPLDLGADIAKNFGVFDSLRPIFEFTYVEGKSETPPPAPKHSHASASNVAKRQSSVNNSSGDANSSNKTSHARKTKSMTSLSGEPPKKRGRPKRVPMQNNIEPSLQHTDTTPITTIPESGPSIGTFNNKKSLGHPTLTRQDTEQDALQIMASNMSANQEDLELADKSSDEDMGNRTPIDTQDENIHHEDNDELMTGRELFGTPRNSFERIVQSHNQSHNHLNGSIHDPYGLSQYHHHTSHTHSMRDDAIYADYFTNLLNYFLEDGNNKVRSTQESNIPDKILNPPQPLSKINITQPVDNEGNTIFHWACSMANNGMIEFLLATFESFLNSDLKNNRGETPLMFLVKFSNSYQLKNFPTLLDLLFDSILSIDNYGRTVLHHIALAANNLTSEGSINANTDIHTFKKNKERFARYYMECLFAKIIEFQEIRDSQEIENKKLSLSDKKELIAKFINHQDIDGNTAFHIVAYNLNKKCIKVFISYHKYINFHLKNLVSYTVEEYLASHNHVLRLDTSNDDSKEIQDIQEEAYKYLNPQFQGNNLTIRNNSTQSFESQMYFSKMAVNLQNTTANLITEKLTELAYIVDKELSEKDEKLLMYFKLLKAIGHEKLLSQRAVLQFFKLEYLIDDIMADYDQNNSDNLIIDTEKDRIIQDEINRLISDLSFQFLQRKDQLDQVFMKYKAISSAIQNTKVAELASTLSQHESNSSSTEDETPSEQVRLSIELQTQIVKYKQMLHKLHQQHLQVPLSSLNDNTDTKENKENIKEESQTNDTAEPAPHSVIAKYPKDDKLHKYCKLIALCCGMNFNDVENSIDLIEQSLSKSAPNMQ
ncbi:DEHA2D07436p [Debaryomyces hansenii CBS767]|uniref:Transcription factor MBP1 n=1 Tax=Debaryomyces hansenii (strain ATCC 36239 / CBS 767 / BCRC 21394 / JCM 1990 / NBRC 0083 / IGC 2968) TaxID=284592 RepID=B5RTE9_DEBHA|nr:DEHA2D07436p [Debaryomyces hansenii CBS767]CAR65634.1 DEHA2D07436p [Debaryomyces hansenii CBS767]|eukprot:XP_002770278.1 DEHA2D07436p [Debaryomyces hansenii CBS767]